MTCPGPRIDWMFAGIDKGTAHGQMYLDQRRELGVSKCIEHDAGIGRWQAKGIWFRDYEGPTHFGEIYDDYQPRLKRRTPSQIESGIVQTERSKPIIASLGRISMSHEMSVNEMQECARSIKDRIHHEYPTMNCSHWAGHYPDVDWRHGIDRDGNPISKNFGSDPRNMHLHFVLGHLRVENGEIVGRVNELDPKWCKYNDAEPLRKRINNIAEEEINRILQRSIDNGLDRTLVDFSDKVATKEIKSLTEIRMERAAAIKEWNREQAINLQLQLEREKTQKLKQRELELKVDSQMKEAIRCVREDLGRNYDRSMESDIRNFVRNVAAEGSDITESAAHRKKLCQHMRGVEQKLSQSQDICMSL